MDEKELQCIIHLTENTGESCQLFTKTRWATFQQSAGTWLQLTGPSKFLAERCRSFLSVPFETLYSDFESEFRAGFHPTCYQRFIDKKRIASARKKTTGPTSALTTTTTTVLGPQHTEIDDRAYYYGTSPKRLRSNAPAALRAESRVLPPVCIICKREEKCVTLGHKRQRDRLLKAETITGGKLLHTAEMKKDENILLHLRGTDCVAAEVRYHASCYRSYTRCAYKPTTKPTTKPTERPSSSQFHDAYQSFCTSVIEKRIINDQEILRMTQLVKLLLKSLDAHGIINEDLRSDKLKYWLKRDYPQLTFQAPSKRNTSAFVYCEHASSVDTMIEKIHEISYIPTDDSTTDDEDCEQYDYFNITPGEEKKTELYGAGLILRKAISQCSGLSCKWPPTASDVTIDAARNLVPIELFNFLAWVIDASQEPTLDNKVCIPESVECKVLSICQDIIYLASNGRKQTPKSLCLGMAVRHLSGSTRLIDILNHLGHSTSVDSLMRLDTSPAELQLLKGVNQVPTGFQKSFPTILVWDNIDFREETPTGHGTTHYTNGIMIQSKCTIPEPGLQSSQFNVQKCKRRFQAPPSIILPYHRKTKQGPTASTSVSLIPLESGTYQNLLQKADYLEFVFVGLRYKNSETHSVPGWTGFNTLLHQDDNPEKSAIHYLPVIEASPTEISTVNAILKQSCTIAQSLEIEHVVVVFDENIYAKAQEIRWTNPHMMKKLVLRLGEFHICMSFMGIIGKRYRDAGLRDLMIESGVIAEGSVYKVLDGHHYNRSVRVHKLVYEALQQLRMDAFLESLSLTNREQVSACLADLQSSFDRCLDKKSFKSLKILAFQQAYNDFVRSMSEQDPTFKLWSSYLDMVTLLLHFIRATRESDWQLHLSAVRCMIPWFFAYDHVHYARYLPAYWIEMMSLPSTHPTCSENFAAGLWTVQRQDRYSFSAIACDQAIEQTCNRDSKTKGGFTGLTRHPGAVQRWLLTQPERSAITRQCETMAGTSPELRQRKDLDATRTARDKDTVQKIVNTVQSMVNPFDVHRSDLISISSGMLASSAVQDDLVKACEFGEKLAVNFMKEQLVSNTSDIYDKIPQQKLKTFTSMLTKKVPTKDGKHIIIQNDRNIFARLLVVGQHRDIKLREVLSYSLGSVSFPLSTSDGSLAKTNKSILIKLIKEKVSVTEDEIPENVTLIIDGMALIQTLPSSSATFGDFARLVLSTVVNQAKNVNAIRVDIVYDQYLKCSIKDPERKRRGCTDCQEIAIYSPDQKLPTQWKKFLASGKNKESLIHFLYSVWKSDYLVDMKKSVTIPVYFTRGNNCSCLTNVDGVPFVQEVTELNSDHEEADTRLLLHAKHASMSTCNIVVKSPDTDVFIIMCTLSSSVEANLYFMWGTKSQCEILGIRNVVSGLGHQMCKTLIGLHTFTGCDSTSAFCGKGKRKAFDIVQSNVEFHDVFCNLGNGFEFDEQLLPSLERFVCKIYGQDTSDINEARYRLFCLKSLEQSLPPTRDALLQHCKRVNYQAAISKHAVVALMNRPSPDKHGWEIINDELVIKWMTKPPAPDTVLKSVNCKCKTSKCGTKRCSCRTVNLKCTELCQCKDCENFDISSSNEPSSNSDTETLSDEEL